MNRNWGKIEMKKEKKKWRSREIKEHFHCVMRWVENTNWKCGVINFDKGSCSPIVKLENEEGTWFFSLSKQVETNLPLQAEADAINGVTRLVV